MWPLTFEDLKSAPSFIINLARHPERLVTTQKRLVAAGFGHLIPAKAVDGRAEPDRVVGFLSTFKHASFRRDLALNPGAIGCFLSHVLLWKHIVDSGIMCANVFEDDIAIHDKFEEEAKKYYENTPMNWHLLFMGAELAVHLDGVMGRRPTFGSVPTVTTCPTFCTHAYTITLAGAQVLLSWMAMQPVLAPLDEMIALAMLQTAPPIVWYAWDARDSHASAATPGNHGLILQDPNVASTIRNTLDSQTELGAITFDDLCENIYKK